MVSGGKGKSIIHNNLLVTSRQDDIALADAVEYRFLKLSKDHLRIRGNPLLIPATLDADMVLWRTMRVRHKKGDFRHSEVELKGTQSIAEWTLIVNAEIHNQKKPQKIDWR